MRRSSNHNQGGVLGLMVVAALLLAGCTTVAPRTTGKIEVVAAERQWGSIVQAIGGNAVEVTNVISSPTIDPHAYEPSPRDANAIARANYVVENGLGYDSWTRRLVAASGNSALVLDIGEHLHLSLGANPHRWYSPTDVVTITKAIDHDLSELRPALTEEFHRRAVRFRQVSLARFNAERAWIRANASGISVGASESMFSLLVDDLHLHLATPERFLLSVSEGGEPTARDLSAINASITSRAISLYLENTQNITPAVAAQVDLARSMTPPIPIVEMTETPPRSQTFAEWQTAQLTELVTAVKKERP